jgi:outer membrane protein assembly factor BamB
MRTLQLGLVLTLGIPFFVGWGAAASSWPRFRGPNGTGVAADKGIPVHWDEKEGIIWKRELPGSGNSSPVIWGRKVFLQSSSDDGKERQLVCLDAADGRILWTRSVTASTDKKHSKNTYASSTPATDGQRVYALFWDGARILLTAYNFEGNRLWERDLGAFNTSAPTDGHGCGASPMVFGDRVFLANDQSGKSVLVAVDARTGEIAWEAPRKSFRTCYSTPFVLERPGAGPELIVASTAGITSYEPGSGRENWAWTWTFDKASLRTVASPIFTQGLIIASSGDGSGDRHTVAVKPGEDRSTPALIWGAGKRVFPYVPTMLASGDYLYFVNDGGFAGCIEAATGRVLWDERLGDGDVTASPVLIDGKIYAINEKGVAYVFKAAPTYQPVAKSSLGEKVLASPAVSDGRLYIRGEKHLFCIGKTNGRSTE